MRSSLGKRTRSQEEKKEGMGGKENGGLVIRLSLTKVIGKKRRLLPLGRRRTRPMGGNQGDNIERKTTGMRKKIRSPDVHPNRGRGRF